MIPYIFVFIISIFITFIGQKIYKSNRTLAWILFILSIVFISLFSALRNFNVGTDVKVYGIKYFNYTLQFDSLIEYIKIYKSEQLYHAMNYIFSHYIGNIRYLFFFMTFFQLIIIYIYTIKKNHKNISLALFTYLMLYFNTSLNILRQTISIFIIILAFEKLIKEKYIHYILLIALAYFFHSSSILMLLLIPIQKLANSKTPYKNLILISISMIVLFSSLSILLKYSSSLPLFIRKYLGYIRNSQTNLNFKYLLYKIIFLLGFLRSFRYCKNDRTYTKFVYFAVFDVIFYFLSNYINYGYRLSYYFLIFYVFSIPYIRDKMEQKREKNIFSESMILLMIGYWIIRYVIIGYDGTIPYTIL